MPLHLFIAHFPLALIVLGAAADLLGTVLRREGLRRWAGTLLIAGAAFALLALVSGARAMSVVLSQPDPPYQLVAQHSQWGGAAIWPLAGGGVLRAIWRGRLTGIHGWLLLALAIVSAVLIVFISISGVAISH